MKEYNRILVTAALPYANGPVHIGHLAGCYIPADIYVRYQRARKKIYSSLAEVMNMVFPLPSEL